ncbi:MAG: hypothetical protein IJF58_02495 [Clostridia bacterium]|nr:hypothetical protein [Clostridia bacterium]
MAKCEKCSAEIAEGLTLCENCKNDSVSSVDMWARPGSVANSGNSYVKPVETVKTTATVDETPNEPAPVSAQSNELDMRLKQTEFFNAVANVSEEETVDVDDFYPPNNLLEVPFRDTEYNLGYTIPKMKMVVSKKTRRKILFSSLIVSAVALLVAGFILLDSAFGILPRVVDTPVLYVKSSNLYMTGTSGKRPQHFAYEGNAFQVSNNTQRVHFSPYNDEVFVMKNYNTKTKNYDLYIRRDGEVSSQGSLVDSNMHGEFKYVQRGNAILYLKGSSTYDLYLYNIDKGESTRVTYGVESFGMINDTKVAMKTRSNDIQIVDLLKSGKEAITPVVEDVDKAYFDAEPTSSFFYIKTLKNTETGKDISELYRYDGTKTEKVAQNVKDLVAYNCAENWAYCTGDVLNKITIGDFINDDCEKEDRESTEGVAWGNDMSADMAMMLKRNTLRSRVFPIEIDTDAKQLSYYSKGKAKVISEYCTEVVFTGERKELVNKDVADVVQGAAIVYKEYQPGQKILTFSELTDDMLNNRTFTMYLSEAITAAINNTHYFAAVKGNAAKLNYTALNDDNISFSKKFDAVYYIDYTEDDEEGDLMQVKITDKGFKEPEAVANSVTEFYNLADGTVIYVDSDKTIYAGSEALAHRISGYSVNRKADVVAILAETIDTGSRLVVFKDRTKKAIAESVKMVCFNDNTTLSFIKDFDSVAGGGDFYICKNFNTVSRIDTGVSSTVRLKY